MVNIKFTDNSGEILNALRLKAADALSDAGALAVSYARDYAPAGTPGSTGINNYHGGKLKNSIRSEVRDMSCYIGTDVPYAVYTEFGTGIYSSEGKGRKSPWVWFDFNGDAHFTRGIRPSHFLKNSVVNHRLEYLRVLKNSLSIR